MIHMNNSAVDELKAAFRGTQEDHDLRNSELVEAALAALKEVAPTAYAKAITERVANGE